MAQTLVLILLLAASVAASAVSAAQMLVVLEYTCAPVVRRYTLGGRGDIPTILPLWLPIEFAAESRSCLSFS